MEKEKTWYSFEFSTSSTFTEKNSYLSAQQITTAQQRTDYPSKVEIDDHKLSACFNGSSTQ